VDAVPWGYLTGVLVALAAVVVAVRPPPTNGPRATPAFLLGTASSEVPMVFLLLLFGSTVLAVVSGDLVPPAGLVIAGLAALAAAGLVWVQVEAFAARRAVVDAVDAVVAGGCGPAPSLRPAEHWRTALAPLRWPSRDLQVVRNLSYGPHGVANTLDVVRRRGGLHDAPVLVHLHGGGYFSGRKSQEARLLMQALAHRGWLCVSANYRLTPGSRFPEILVDAKRVIAWVRTEGRSYGAGRTVVACGGSAGANLAMTAALTAKRADLQPGFEDVDTAVQAVVALYGYYGPAPTDGMPSAPGDHLTPDTPPVLVVHGALDPMAPAADARTLVQRLRATSASPVVYAEVPGMLHAFDRFDSVRHGGVAVGVLHFLDRVGLTPEDDQP
jgi:acetyl esterase/lipase